MDYQGLSTDDLANVRALNRNWLQLTGRDERLAAAPFLLFSFRERDAALWDRLLGQHAQHELFVNKRQTNDRLYDLQNSGLAFLWELSRRNPYVARIVGGAPLGWCVRIASETVARIHECARHRNLIEPRFHRNAAVYRQLSAHMAALQSMLTIGIERGESRLPAAACRMPGPASRVADKV